jgi:hypothetical protein
VIDGPGWREAAAGSGRRLDQPCQCRTHRVVEIGIGEATVQLQPRNNPFNEDAGFVGDGCCGAWDFGSLRTSAVLVLDFLDLNDRLSLCSPRIALNLERRRLSPDNIQLHFHKLPDLAINCHQLSSLAPAAVH